MIINKSITKESVNKLPRVEFPGKIHLIETIEDCDEALLLLNKEKWLGIDSETRPNFVKGRMHKVALLQISTFKDCFLFRLNKIGLTKGLIHLLENSQITKVGLSLKDDFMMLKKRAFFKQNACIDLQDYVKFFGIKDRSLQKIYAILFNEKISKSKRLSNWEADPLTEAQQEYAAIDAWSCLRIYALLEKLKADQNFEVV